MTHLKKTQMLKQLLQSKDLSFLMEAHNGISAKIVEEAGFQGIWGSGLSISASLGVRDNNEASWTQVLEVVEFMSDATKIPILLDGDTGYGNFNNMRRLVRKLESRGVAGVCIEDKIFPKTNSFLRGEKQPLADMQEFSGKIMAGLDARSDDNFCIVARVEALIAGWGIDEALKRAEAYRLAGASAILMHSKISTADEIFAFMKEWGNRCPVVIVPTKYYATPTQEYRERGISTVIWANHLMRSAVKSMQQTAKKIFTEESLINVEDNVVAVKELFRLQNDQELEQAEKLYLKETSESRAIILAASRGKELGELTAEKPKALLNVNGTPILKQLIDKLKNVGATDVTVVRGYKKHAFPDYACRYVDNDNFETTGELSSLVLTLEQMQGELYIAYGDIIFKSFMLNACQDSESDVTIIVDSHIADKTTDYRGDFVLCNKCDNKRFGEGNAVLLKTELKNKSELSFSPHGEWIGLLKCNAKGSMALKRVMTQMRSQINFDQMKMGDLLNALIQADVPVGVVYVDGHWMDIDSYKDFENIQVF